MSRKRFTFWLDDTKNEQNELINQVDGLKQKRTFAKTIRDGIRLVTSLSAGSLDVLFELFPFVRAEFLEYVESLQINSEQGEKKTLASQNEQLQQRVIELESENATLRERNRILEDEIADDNDIIEAQDKELSILRKQKDSRQPAQDNSAIQAQLDRIEQQLLAQGHTPINSPQDSPQSHHIADSSGSAGMKGLGATNGNGGSLHPVALPKPTGPQSLNVPQFSTPTFDDESDDTLLEVKRDESAGDIAVQNFLKSAMGLQELGYDS